MVDANLMPKDDTYYQLSRPELAPFLPANVHNMRILEVGCGQGNFRGHVNCLEYWGIEPNSEMANRASVKLDKVLLGSFEEVENNLPNNYFDLIICNDVIEHMNDVDYFLQSIQLKMTFNGFMLGSIPNVRFAENIARFLFLRDWRYTEWGILDKTHLRFFTQKSLKRLFGNNNLKVEKLEGINSIQIKLTSTRSFCLNLGLLIFSIICGKDSRYFQFGFLVRRRY